MARWYTSSKCCQLNKTPRVISKISHDNQLNHHPFLHFFYCGHASQSGWYYFHSRGPAPDSVLVQCQCPVSQNLNCPLQPSARCRCSGGRRGPAPRMQKLPGEARGHGALVTVVTALVQPVVVMKMFAPLPASCSRCSVAASPHFTPGHCGPESADAPRTHN